MAIALTAPASPRRIDTALAIVRVIVGAIFIAHGAQKLFGFGFGGTIGFFTQIGAPLPTITAPLIAILEFFGGIALVLGFLSRFVAIGLVLDMLGAIALVHIKAGFFAPKGVEFPLSLVALAAAIAIAGPGAFSIDARLFARRDER